MICISFKTILGIKVNLHIALIMDCTNSKFILNCESNPALYKECSVQWMEGWSRDSMIKVRYTGPFTPGQQLLIYSSFPSHDDTPN